MTTANAPQPMCGETLSDAVIVERRNSPRQLRANDDDDEKLEHKNLFGSRALAGPAGKSLAGCYSSSSC